MRGRVSTTSTTMIWRLDERIRTSLSRARAAQRAERPEAPGEPAPPPARRGVAARHPRAARAHRPRRPPPSRATYFAPVFFSIFLYFARGARPAPRPAEDGRAPSLDPHLWGHPPIYLPSPTPWTTHPHPPTHPPPHTASCSGRRDRPYARTLTAQACPRAAQPARQPLRAAWQPPAS